MLNLVNNYNIYLSEVSEFIVLLTTYISFLVGFGIVSHHPLLLVGKHGLRSQMDHNAIICWIRECIIDGGRLCLGIKRPSCNVICKIHFVCESFQCVYWSIVSFLWFSSFPALSSFSSEYILMQELWCNLHSFLFGWAWLLGIHLFFYDTYNFITANI